MGYAGHGRDRPSVFQSGIGSQSVHQGGSIQAALEPVCALGPGFGGLAQIGCIRIIVGFAQKQCDRQGGNNARIERRARRAGKPVRPFGRHVRPGVPAGIGDHCGFDVRIRCQHQETMDELRSGRMSEYRIPVACRTQSGTHGCEQGLDGVEG